MGGSISCEGTSPFGPQQPESLCWSISSHNRPILPRTRASLCGPAPGPRAQPRGPAPAPGPPGPARPPRTGPRGPEHCLGSEICGVRVQGLEFVYGLRFWVCYGGKVWGLLRGQGLGFGVCSGFRVWGLVRV